MQGKKGGRSGRGRVKGQGSEVKGQIWSDPFGHGFGILLEFGFYSKSNEKTLERFKRESGMIDLRF